MAGQESKVREVSHRAPLSHSLHSVSTEARAITGPSALEFSRLIKQVRPLSPTKLGGPTLGYDKSAAQVSTVRLLLVGCLASTIFGSPAPCLASSAASPPHLLAVSPSRPHSPPVA